MTKCKCRHTHQLGDKYRNRCGHVYLIMRANKIRWSQPEGCVDKDYYAFDNTIVLVNLAYDSSFPIEIRNPCWSDLMVDNPDNISCQEWYKLSTPRMSHFTYVQPPALIQLAKALSEI